MSLNAALLAISGVSVYLLLQWRSTRLPPEEQRILQNEVLVARGSAKPRDAATDIDENTERLLLERLSKKPGSTSGLGPAQVRSRLADLLGAMEPAQLQELHVPEIRKQLREQIKSEFEAVPPSY